MKTGKGVWLRFLQKKKSPDDTEKVIKCFHWWKWFCGWACWGLEFPTLLHPSYEWAFPALLPRRHCQHCRDAQEVGTEGEQTPNTTNSTGQGEPGCSMASPQQGLLLRTLGPHQSLMAWFSPPQNKRKKIQVVMQLLNQASFMKHISCQEMLPLVSSSAPWDEALPCSASPAPSTAGYTFCQGPFINTVGLSKPVSPHWGTSAQALSAEPFSPGSDNISDLWEAEVTGLWSGNVITSRPVSPAVAPCPLTMSSTSLPCPRSELERSDSLFWVSSSAGGCV